MNARNQMDPKFMWDFSHMFETKEAWEAAYAECEADIAKLSSLAGTLCASAESLKAGLDEGEGRLHAAHAFSHNGYIGIGEDGINALDNQIAVGSVREVTQIEDIAHFKGLSASLFDERLVLFKEFHYAGADNAAAQHCKFIHFKILLKI